MRYTVIIIDHEDSDRARIMELDDFQVLADRQKPAPKIVPQSQKRVFPNYEKVTDLLSKEEPKKKDKSLAQRIQKMPKEKKRKTPQELFQGKLEKEQYDEFNANDLVCFFRHTAEKKNIRYAANWQKDNAHMKKLQEQFSNMELISMIEFLFLSKQKYLEKRKLSVGILTTGWLNTIFQDTQLWLDDKYVPENKGNSKPREWTEDKPEDGTDITIGW